MALEYQFGVQPTLELAAQKGEEVRQERAEERRSQISRLLLDQQFRREAEERNREWTLEKMELQSRHELALQQLRDQALFERQVAKELQQQEELEAGMKAIRESSVLTEADKELAMIQLLTKVPAYTQETITERKGIKPIDPIEQLIYQSLGIETPTLPAEPGEFPTMPIQRSIGDIVYKGGKAYKITGFTDEGKTIVEEVKQPEEEKEGIKFYKSAKELREAEFRRFQ